MRKRGGEKTSRQTDRGRHKKEGRGCDIKVDKQGLDGTGTEKENFSIEYRGCVREHILSSGPNLEGESL